MKIALVTGANKGIGKEAARQLAGLGFKVLLGSRNKERGEAALKDVPGSELVLIDSSSELSIKAAAAAVERRHGRLDALINNAGVYIDRGSKPSEVPLNVLRETFETNFFGPVACIQAFLPLLLKSPAPRIVNVSSTMGSLERGRHPALAYSSSKTALNAVTTQFAVELAATPVKINSVCPGWVKTDMGGEGAPCTVEEGARIIVRLATIGADGPTGGFFDDAGPIPW